LEAARIDRCAPLFFFLVKEVERLQNSLRFPLTLLGQRGEIAVRILPLARLPSDVFQSEQPETRSCVNSLDKRGCK